MGNQIKESESSKKFFHDQIQILKWRADPEHNTHIARAISLQAGGARSKAFQKVIKAQIANKTFIDVANLASFQQDKESSQRQKQLVVFEDYIGSLVIMEDSLSMEEIIYVLITLLFGYEEIYKKMSQACVHQSCCHLTPEGEVRVWIHSDPISCLMDIQLIKRKDRQNISGNESSGKVLCGTEASICKNILSMSYRLSDKSGPFVSFYREVKNFMNENMLQNINFIAIRTFINRFIYRYRLVIKNNLFQAMKRVHRQCSFCQINHKQPFIKAKSHNRTASIQQFSLESIKMNLPIISGQRPESNIDHKISDLHMSNQHLKSDQHRRSLKFAKKSLKPINNQINTSQTLYHNKCDICLSTQIQTPKTASCFLADNQLSSSQLNVSGQINKTFNKIDFNKEKNDVQKIDNNNRAFRLAPQQAHDTKKLVRFHSYDASFENREAINFLHLNTANLEKQNDFCTQNSLSKIHKNLNGYNKSANQNKHSRFITEAAFSQQSWSKIYNRVVSGLISNKQIDVCESMGSFQSFQSSEASSYSGVLLGMGRSVQIAKSPSKRKLSSNFRNGTSQHMTPHMTL